MCNEHKSSRPHATTIIDVVSDNMLRFSYTLQTCIVNVDCSIDGKTTHTQKIYINICLVIDIII